MLHKCNFGTVGVVCTFEVMAKVTRFLGCVSVEDLVVVNGGMWYGESLVK